MNSHCFLFPVLLYNGMVFFKYHGLIISHNLVFCSQGFSLIQEKINSLNYTLICNEKTLLTKKKTSSEVNLKAVPRTAVMDISGGVKYYCNMRFLASLLTAVFISKSSY